VSKNIRIGNCSGFYGDKLSAAKEMVEGGPIDVLTGDYLAELTMAILYNQKLQRGEDKGYVGTFFKQLKEVATTCKEKNIKIISNAGGLNPESMAKEVVSILAEIDVDAKVAYIDGDNLIDELDQLQTQGETFENIDRKIPLSESGCKVLTANTYLGCWGIKEALDLGADIVICPRVTDASLTMGAAAWKFNWQRDDYDALAGSLAAGHIIECGAQATGGNYSFFEEVPTFKDIGYPIAQIEKDGSFTITKHPDTGGLVSIGTVTAQLLYEIAAPEYLNPDVIAHFDTLKIKQVSDDKVQVTGCKGSSPPSTHKVCINLAGGYRNGMELILTGLDIERKAKTFSDALFDTLGGKEQFDDVAIELYRQEKKNPQSNEEAMASLRINVTSQDPSKVGRIFTAKVVELGLANYPGFFSKSAPGSGAPFILYWPALINSKHIKETLHMDEKTVPITPTNQLGLDNVSCQTKQPIIPQLVSKDYQQIHFGRIYGTRSGDKGGCANLGVWAKTDKAYEFLYHFLTVDRLKQLLPDMAQFPIDRYELANIKSLNFYVHGILQDGVSSSTRMDAQAKSLGEYLRAKLIDAPVEII
tara:strand:- start:2145 stop:3905 length:1761 start_codon:yes stop_codon:yes gene_type:complete